MQFKVFIQQIDQKQSDVKEKQQSLLSEDPSGCAPSSNDQQPNLNIRVKCCQSQEEFRGQAFLNAQYIQKLQRWVSKHKFNCIFLNNNTEMELRVQIFKFHLKKVQKTDIETLKQEICQMRKDNDSLKGELKLFRYYFLHLWRDKYRKDINQHENQEFRHKLVQSTNHLYDIVEANGLILEEFGAKTYYLTFNSEAQLKQYQEIQPGGNISSDQIMSGSTPSHSTQMGMTPGFGGFMGVTPGGMITPGGMTPGMTPGMTFLGAQSSSNGGAQDKNQSQSNSSLEGMSNLMGRINQYSAMIQSGETIVNDQMQISSIQDKPMGQQELEIFVNGGGNGSLQYKYKKAALDFSKMQASADGAVMLRVNCPVSDGHTYSVQIPKKLTAQ